MESVPDRFEFFHTTVFNIYPRWQLQLLSSPPWTPIPPHPPTSPDIVKPPIPYGWSPLPPPAQIPLSPPSGSRITWIHVHFKLTAQKTICVYPHDPKYVVHCPSNWLDRYALHYSLWYYHQTCNPATGVLDRPEVKRTLGVNETDVFPKFLVV